LPRVERTVRADLIGERLKREGVVRRSEALERVSLGPWATLGGGEDGNGFLKTALEEVAEAGVGHAAQTRAGRARGQM